MQCAMSLWCCTVFTGMLNEGCRTVVSIAHARHLINAVLHKVSHHEDNEYGPSNRVHLVARMPSPAAASRSSSQNK
jgi:hypothetical protein